MLAMIGLNSSVFNIELSIAKRVLNRSPESIVTTRADIDNDPLHKFASALPDAASSEAAIIWCAIYSVPEAKLSRVALVDATERC
jgi:hypothetical protein